MTRSTQRHRVRHVRTIRRGENQGQLRDVERADTLVGEQPLEIRLNGTSYTVTMRTPGADFAMVAGFLLSEGVITAHEQIQRMDYRSGVTAEGLRDYNVIDVRLPREVAAPVLERTRAVYTSSACGVCGTSSIEEVTRVSPYEPLQDPLRLSLAQVLALPQRLRDHQKLFSLTGGVHAAGLFSFAPGSSDAAGQGDAGEPGGVVAGENGRDDDAGEPTGTLLCVREDVGRHNAVDKVIGHALENGLVPVGSSVLQVSGRASYELVQKAAMAGIPVLSAVSAPSALAVDLAEKTGLTLVGFNRGDGLNVYTHGHRIGD